MPQVKSAGDFTCEEEICSVRLGLCKVRRDLIAFSDVIGSDFDNMDSTANKPKTPSPKNKPRPKMQRKQSILISGLHSNYSLEQH